MPVVEPATAQGHRVHLQPAWPRFGPTAPDGNALAQQVSGTGAAPPRQPHPQRGDQAIQGACAGAQEAPTHVRIDPAMVQFVGRQPLGQQRVQPAAAGLEGREPDRLQGRQERRRLIGLGPAQHHIQAGGSRRGWLGSQSADGRFAVVTQQFDRLIQQFAFVSHPSGDISSPQPGHDSFLRFFAHIVVHLG